MLSRFTLSALLTSFRPLPFSLVLKRNAEAEDGADFHAETFKCLPYTPCKW